METIRLHVQDSLYALLVTYLKLGTRDIFNSFDSTWGPNDRSVVLDDVNFNIVKKIPGQAHEIPGVNLVLYDEQSAPFAPNHQTYTRLACIHLYVQTSTNISADDRTLLKLQRQLDEALYGKGLSLVDFYSVPPVALVSKAVSWDLLNPAESWQELTDLANSSYLHRAKNIRLFYADFPIV